MPDTLSFKKLHYDFGGESLNFHIEGLRGDKTITIFGSVPAEATGNLEGADVSDICRASLKQALLNAAALL